MECERVAINPCTLVWGIKCDLGMRRCHDALDAELEKNKYVPCGGNFELNYGAQIADIEIVPDSVILVQLNFTAPLSTSLERC